MQTSPIQAEKTEKLEEVRALLGRFSTLSSRYRNDASLRARLEDGDVMDSLETLGIDVPPGVQAKVVVDNSEVMHFILPPDPNVSLEDEALNAVAGGKTAGTGATVGTAGSMATSTVPSTVGSGGTISTAGSAQT